MFGIATDPLLFVQVPKEPMYIIINLAFASSFSKPDWENIKFPAQFKVDWIRLYQYPGEEDVGCDPPDMPTKAYIERHWEAVSESEVIIKGRGRADCFCFPCQYHNANLTTWTEPKGKRGGYGHAL